MTSMRLPLLCLAVAAATTAAAAAERRPITVEDLWAIQRVGAPAVSPDGRQVAFGVSVYDMDENRGNGDLWLVPVAGGAPRRLTTNKAGDSSPDWSPDGRRIAFVSKREGDTAAQLYVIPVDGGEPERLTDLPLGVDSPRFFPDGRRIAFVSHVIAGSEAPDALKKAVEAREKAKVKARITESRLFRFWDRWLTDQEFPHLFVIDLETKKVTDLLPGSKLLFGFQDGSTSYDISPDGVTIAFTANATEAPYATLNSDVFTVPSVGGEVKNLTGKNPADDGNPVWSPDGRSLAYTLDQKADGWPDWSRLALLDVATGQTRVLTEAFGTGATDHTFTRDGGTLLFHSEVRARKNLYAVPVTGGAPKLLRAGGSTSGAQPAADGQVVFLESSLRQPAELAVVPLAGRISARTPHRWLTDVNEALLARLSLGEVEDATFKGAGDDDVQMFLVYPPGFDRAKKYPLVHMIHGGPVGTFGDEFGFRWNPHMFASPGYVVALVNFHGSSSFGQPWVESILGAHPDKPFTDIMKATDALIARGFVDETRMAATGGSYGGFMVNWILGHTDRFKALVSHAGVYSLLGQSASDSYFGRHHSYGGYPFTNLENIERWSPNRFAANFKTPTLVTHGERDYRVPVTQGLELYGVLKTKGVPARLVYFPDENHWILKPQNSRLWYTEVLAWLGRWLK
jgi:dipeptidyl aminopeptidase/acylaminoacyl peptidase